MSEAKEDLSFSPDAAGLLSSLLSNPDAVSKVSEVISRLGSGEKARDGNFSPLITENTENAGEENSKSVQNADKDNSSSPVSAQGAPNDISNKLPELLSLLSSSASSFSPANKEQTALLLAIRPYLSEHRRGLIDSFIRMNRLGEILKKLT